MIYIVLLGILWNIKLLLQSLYSLRILKTQKLYSTQDRDKKLYILIAIRNEEMEHVHECIEYFLAQQEITKLIICLTEIGNDHTKYLTLLEEFQDQDSRLTYTTFKGAKGYKAEQVNTALEDIQKLEEEIIVGIYDIDSRPDKAVFDYVLSNEIQVGQQFILYDANLDDLNPLSLAGALHQTSWAIGFEMFNFFHPKNRLVYTIGHGLYLSIGTLNKCGLFEENCMTEDLMYGYKASVAKREFQVIPYFEHAKFVKTAREFIYQSERWYTGELELIHRFKVWHEVFKGGFKDKLHFYFRIIELLWWPLERLLYIFTVLAAILGLLNMTVALLYTGVLILSGYISATVILKSHGWNRRLLVVPLLVPIWHTVSVVGPLAALIKKILGSSAAWTITKK